MDFFKHSGTFYYLRLTPAGEILEGNNCFFNDIEAGSNAPEQGRRALFLPDFLPGPAAQKLKENLQELASKPTETRFDAHFRLYYSPDATHYVLTDWEFCKDAAGIIGAGRRAVTDAARHHYVPPSPDSQELFEVFLQQSENIVFIKDSDGAYLSASPAFYRHFNLFEEETIGLKDADILDEKMEQQCQHSDLETLREGLTTFHVEYDQEGRQYEVTKFPFTLSSGQRVIGGIMRETTEQLNMDNRLRYIAEQVPGLLFEFHQLAAGKTRSTPGHYNYISPKIYEYTGYTAEEVLDDYIIPYDLIHSSDRPRVKQKLAEAKRRVQACTLEYRSYHRNAPGMRWLRSVSQPVLQADDSVIWYGIVTDITGIKEKEEALRGAEHKFHLVAENMADGIVVFNEEKRIIYASASVYEQFERPAGSLTGMQLDEILNFICAEDRARIRNYILESVRDKKEHFRYEYRILNEAGDAYWREDNTSIVYDENGNIHRAYVVARDITGRKKTEHELRSSLDLLTTQNHRLNSFTHIVSHNLRSHVSNIIGLLDLAKDAETPEQCYEVLPLLSRTASRLDETLHHLNKLVSIQDNHKIKHEKVKLLGHITKNLEIIKGSLEANDAKLSISVPDSLQVYCVPAYLDNILLNLFTNAVKYRCPERHLELRIETRETADFYIVSVGDNGLGIDLKRYKNRLFGMYQTFHENPNARGIGLFITKNQVEAMGGHIEIESQTGTNSGSTFSVYLQKDLPAKDAASLLRPPQRRL